MSTHTLAAAAFVASPEAQHELIMKCWHTFCRREPLREGELRDVAYNAAIDALLRCRKCWESEPPVKPQAYLWVAARDGMKGALDEHRDKVWESNAEKHHGSVSLGARHELYIPARDERPADYDAAYDAYCETDGERQVLEGLIQDMTYEEIEERYGIDDSTACRAHEAIRKRCREVNDFPPEVEAPAFPVMWVRPYLLRGRLRHGWSLERASTTPDPKWHKVWKRIATLQAGVGSDEFYNSL